MRNKIYAIISIIVCFGLCRGCISDHLKGGDKDKITSYEKMLSDNSVTTGQLDPEYKEVTIKIMGAPVKHYEFTYHFNADGRQYKGEHSFDKVPSTDEVRVFYLKSDPGINAIDPGSKLETEKKKNTSNENLYWGIGWGVLGLLTLMGFVKEIREKKKAEAEAAASVV